MFRLTTAAAALAVIAAPSFAEAPRVVTGQVTYLQRIALPAEAKLVISVIGPHGVELVAQEVGVDGKSVPFPFEFTVPEGASGVAQFAFVLPDGSTFFSSDEIVLPVGAEPLDLGEVRLSMGQTLRSSYSCVHGTYQAAVSGEWLTLTDAGGQEMRLKQEISANGARYVEPETGAEFWMTGEIARFTRAGDDAVDCTLLAPKPYIAGGFEPSWGVEINNGAYVFSTASGEPPQAGQALAAPVWQEGGVSWKLAEGLVFTSRQEICRDEATGMPRPETVSVAHGDTLYKGCGGEALDLLLGAPWQIEDVLGGGVVDASEGTLQFTVDGAVYGRAFCNSYNSSFSLNGEAITFGSGMATMMACAESLMDLEHKFLTALPDVRRFDFSADGALQLLTSEGDVLVTARR